MDHPESRSPASPPDRSLRGIDRLLAVMASLRDPDGGCPWDLAQSFATIVPHTIEEAYEVAEAIETAAADAHLKDELGDLLFQVVFYARLAAEDDRFDFDGIADAHANKMISRHPHVFGEAASQMVNGRMVNAGEGADVAGIWEARKEAERARKAEAEGNRSPSVLDGVTGGLPAATRAVKLQKRAARVGFDWPDATQVVAKLDEEIGEIKEALGDGKLTDAQRSDALEDEIGDAFFALANLARHLRIDPERALRRANRKFEKRFRAVEQGIEAAGKTLSDASLDEMEAHWQRAKQVR